MSQGSHGEQDVAAVFRSTAEGETGHAHGHLEYLEETGDPATGLPFGGTDLNLKSAIAEELASTATSFISANLYRTMADYPHSRAID